MAIEYSYEEIYSKPASGIPNSDLSSAVQESLVKANNAVEFTSQSLTAEQKAQARTNIDAEQADATILKQANVVDNVASTSTTAPLSANQGKQLQTEINNLKNIGRFLAILNANAGTVSSQPDGSVGDTYSYKVGDYYRVGTAGSKGPKSTAVYTIDATSGSSNFETTAETYEIGDVIYCSNLTASTSTWVKQSSSGGGTVQDVQVNGTSVLSGGTANIIDSDLQQVKYTSQTLTSQQQAQARANIGASSIITVTILEDGDT